MTHEILNPDTSEKSLNHNFTSERSLTSCSAAIYMYVYRYHINKRLFLEHKTVWSSFLYGTKTKSLYTVFWDNKSAKSIEIVK